MLNDMKGYTVAPETKRTVKNSLPGVGAHTFFPAAYLLMTLTSLLFLGAVSGVGAILIDYWFNGVSNIFVDWQLIYLLASLVVVLPIHIFAYINVRKADRRLVTTFSIRVAHGFLGLYLLITIGSIIALSTWLLALWLNVAFGTGDVDTQLYATSLALLQGVVWSMYATWHFLRVRTEKASAWLYVAVISLLSVGLIVASLVYPLPAYRDVAKDFVKESDLSHIKHEVDEYVDEHTKLPSQLHDVSDLSKEVKQRLSDYTYTAKGDTNFGIFVYELCADFAREKGEGRDTGFGFDSHKSGKQCFTRHTISGQKLQEDLRKYVQDVENGVQLLEQRIHNFIVGAAGAVQQEVSSVEGFVGNQFSTLETHLEGLEGGTTELQREMVRLEGNLTGLQGDTGQLAQDFADVGKFFHDLLCGLGLCEAVVGS